MILKFKSAPIIKNENPLLLIDTIKDRLKLIDNPFNNTILLDEQYFISEPKIHRPADSNDFFYQLYVNIYFASRHKRPKSETYFETETNYIFAKSTSISIETFLTEILTLSYMQFQSLFHQTIQNYKSFGLIKKDTQIDSLHAIPKFISEDIVAEFTKNWNF